jgi:hypothetical protein
LREVREMTSTKMVKWEAKDGRTAEVKIEVTRKMVDDTAYADGYNINLGKKPYENMVISFYLGGKFIARTSSEPTIISDEEAKASGGYASLLKDCVSRLNIIIRKKIYDLVMAAIKEATAEAEQDTEYKDSKKAAEAEQEEKLQETEIPAAAVKAYNQYHGDENEAWEEGNETAWALIQKWAPYIEAQHGTAPEKIEKMSNEMRGEASFGISEG